MSDSSPLQPLRNRRKTDPAFPQPAASNQHIRSLRTSVVSLLLWLSFVVSCLFFGIGENLLVLLLAVGLLLVAVTLIPPGRFMAAFSRQRIDGWWCLWVLAILLFSYHFVSIAPEGGYAVSWTLACLPLWFLGYAALSDRRLLRTLLVATITLFALMSVLRFWLTGQRAFEPLLDTNNYASLLYLLWIPLGHRLLVGYWQQKSTPFRQLLGYLLSMVLAMATFATSSRVGSLIVAAALLGWFVLAIIRRFDLKPWLLLSGLTAGTYGLVLLGAPDIVSSSYNQAEFVTGVEVRAALNSAAWLMFLEAPLTGTGVFTFPLLYPLFRLPGDQSTAGMFVHNDYLQLLVETGPWLVLALAVLVAATMRQLWLGLFGRGDQSLRKFGLAMAVAALLAHSLVNFVFYVLPLGIVFAVLCAELFAVPAPSLDPSVDGSEPMQVQSRAARRTRFAAWLLGLVAAYTGWGYLSLDVAVQGVFGGQPTVGVVREIRGDREAMLDFARQAQALNTRRFTPVLAEALLLAAMLDETVPSANKLEIRDKFRQALAMDPFNPMVYEQYYEFLKRSLDRELLATLRPSEKPNALLLRAVQLDVRRVETIFQLLRVYDRLGQSEQGLTLLRNNVYPWLERIQWDSTVNAGKLIEEMRRRAEAAGDVEFVARLDAKSVQISGFSQAPSEHWLRRWMQSWLAG